MKIGAIVRLNHIPDGSGGLTYPRWHEIGASARRLESEGFDSLWVFDHLIYREPGEPETGIWEGWTMLSALAAVTERVELGPLVACTHFRNPAILAKMAVTLDEVSNGRSILGIGAGWNQPEFEAFGIPHDRRLDRFREALQIIAPLMRDGQVDFDGDFYSAHDAELLPRGPRPGGPPILIGGFGPKMLDLAARYADIWNGGYAGTFDTFAGILERFRAACARTGRSVRTSAVVKVGWPDLARVPAFYEDQYVTGSAQDMANAFRAYASAGVDHIMCQYHPHTDEALNRLVEALHAYRRLP